MVGLKDELRSSAQGSGKTVSEYPETLEQDQELEVAEAAIEKLRLERHRAVNGSLSIPDKTPATEIFLATMFFMVMCSTTGSSDGSKWLSGWVEQLPLNSMPT